MEVFKKTEVENFKFISDHHSDFMNKIEVHKKKHKLAVKQFNVLIYYEFDYEDLLTIIFKLVKFLTGLNIRMELDVKRALFVKFYVKEVVLRKLAEGLEYKMPLKPYAILYSKFQLAHLQKEETNKLKKEEEKLSLLNDGEVNDIINTFNNNCLQFHEQNFDNQYDYPPHFRYEEAKLSKFRRYVY